MPRGATYKLVIKGLLTELRTTSKGYVKKMIVMPQFIELWYKVTENQFDLGLWNQLSQTERNWMIELGQKLKIDNRGLELQHNKESTKLVERLQLLEGSISAGNDSNALKSEFFSILDTLSSRHMLGEWTVSNIKKNFMNTLGRTKESIETIETLRAQR